MVFHSSHTIPQERKGVHLKREEICRLWATNPVPKSGHAAHIMPGDTPWQGRGVWAPFRGTGLLPFNYEIFLDKSFVWHYISWSGKHLATRCGPCAGFFPFREGGLWPKRRKRNPSRKRSKGSQSKGVDLPRPAFLPWRAWCFRANIDAVVRTIRRGKDQNFSSPAGCSVGDATTCYPRPVDLSEASSPISGLGMDSRGSRRALRATIESGKRRMRRL